VEGGFPISVVARDSYDLGRLERALTDLVDAYGRQQEETVLLRRQLEEKDLRLRSLEGQVLEANQKRQDVAKRIDELIAQLDHLDQQLAEAES